MYPSVLSCSVRASSTAMLQAPATSLMRQEPQVPERQALSMNTPAASAASRIVASTGTVAVVLDASKITVPATSADVAAPACGLRLIVPNASVLIWPAGTPSPSSAAL